MRRGWFGSVRSHRMTVSSLLAVARVRPSGDHATEATLSVWPVRGSPRRRGWSGLVRSHSRTVLSSLAVARVCPSGEGHRVHAVGVAGEGIADAAGLVRSVRSHRSTVLSRLAVARVRPSGDERHRVHAVGVAGEGITEAAGLVPVGEVPQQDRVVAAGGGQGVPVG